MAKNRSKKYSSPYSYQSNKKQNSNFQRVIEFGKSQQKALKKKSAEKAQKIKESSISEVEKFLGKYTKLNPFKPMKVFESFGNVYSFAKMSPTKQLETLSRMRALVLERVNEVENSKELQEAINVMPRNFTNTKQYEAFQGLYRNWDFSKFLDQTDEAIKGSAAQSLADINPFEYGYLNENVRRKAFESLYDLLTMATLNPERRNITFQNMLAKEEFISNVYKKSGLNISEEEFRQKFYNYLREKMKSNKSKYDSGETLIQVMMEVENDVSVLDLDLYEMAKQVAEDFTKEAEFESEMERSHQYAQRAMLTYQRDKQSKLGRKKENIFAKDYTASALRSVFQNDRGGII